MTVGKNAGKGPAGGRPGERGSALVSAALVCLVLSAMALYVFNRSSVSTSSAQLRGNYADAEKAAEYGAKLAISEISSWMERNKDNPDISGDWVLGLNNSLFVDKAGTVAADQRRIQGYFGDQEFRVLVRSVGLAKKNETMDTDWMWTPGENDRVYEIVSAARNRNAGQGVQAELLTQAGVQAVVNFKFGGGMDGSAIGGASAFFETPAGFSPALGLNPGEEGERPNLVISGEDHDIRKYFIEEMEEVDRIITPLKLVTATANYFDARGGYWQQGLLTLNYRLQPEGRVNPYRPKTSAFGTGADNRAMITKYPDQEPDTYLLGGKQSKTVTLDANGRINETNTNQANAGGNFNVVLGAFEDLMNLYINMAGVYGGIDDQTADASGRKTRPNWFQQYVGQYTELPRNSNLSAASFPVYAGNKVRAQTLHLLKNKDDKILVREFEKTSGGRTTYHKWQTSGSTWKGNYAWCAMSGFGTTVTSGENDDSKGRTVVPRTFMWQELVGFSLWKRDGGGATGEPALRTPPNLPNATQNAANQAKDRAADKRTHYRLDAQGQRIPVGFDEEYQKRNGDGSLADRNDPIMVRQPDGSLKAHATMNDFLFEKDFGLDAEGKPIVRDALCLFIAYEDQLETNSGVDYNYADMMFSIYVAPETKRKITPPTIFGLVSQQWWERDEQEGLTDLPAHPGLTVNPDPATAGSDSLFGDNFGLLNHAPKGEFEEQIYSKFDRGGDKYGKLPRAEFERDGKGSTGILVPKADGEGNDLSGPYYYSADDVTDYIIREWNVNKTIPPREEAEAKLLALNPGRQLKPISSRWEDANVGRPVLSGDPGDSSLLVTEKEVMLRQLAADLIGYKYQVVPAVKTAGGLRLDRREINPDDPGEGYPEPVPTRLGFLAGEFLQTPGAETLAGPGEGEAVPHRELTISQPDGSETPIRRFLAADPAEAVALCYEDYYRDDPETKAELKKLYGMKEERYSLGFHRSGADEKYQSKLVQDHYEVASLGVPGFNPYLTTRDGEFIAAEREGDPEAEPPENPAYKIGYKYGGSEVPDFVFDQPIDGAGILVVNGNLVVADEFSYHGLLLVLGDLVIRPTLKREQFVYGQSGNPLDAYGNDIHELTPGRWGYDLVDAGDPSRVTFCEFQLDDDGNRIKDANGNDVKVEPLRKSLYRGRLTVQGAVMVKGRLITEAVANELAAPAAGADPAVPPPAGPVDSAGPAGLVHGEFRSYASNSAWKMVKEISRVNKNEVRLVSWTNSGDLGNADIKSLWTGELKGTE
ncbi:MAG: pilus assembly PilX N-terminal domain-containing protein [Planctomycetota bacterium]|jgi:hypothetical protein|nr:pilus assembly PilX N-terminal domain-containing protein [Planctomycetota bacterium]